MSPRGGPPIIWELIPLDPTYAQLSCEAAVLGRQCKHPARGGAITLDGEAVILCWQHARMLARDHWLGLHPRRAPGEVQSLAGMPDALRMRRQLRMEEPQ